MDKYEFKLSLEEINRLIQERRYDEAADIADGIDWSHVGNANTLRRISEVYKAVGDYDRSRNVMAIALKREPDNPAIIYSLCELTIYLYGRDGLQSDLASSMQLMQEYQALEPKNPKRLVLQYKFYGVSGVSEQEKIQVLEQLRREQFSARWGYELAKCYAGIGEKKAAAQTCTDVIEIFGGRYGGRAQELLDQMNLSSGADQGEPAAPEPLKERQAEESVPDEKTAPSDGSGLAEEGSGAAEEKPAEPEPVRTKPEPETARPADLSDSVPKMPEESSVQKSVRRGPTQEPVRVEEPVSSGEQEPILSAAASAQEEPLAETGRQASINEVMAEWERIRADIRKANDEKRTQRILEDTGALLQDFEETARHSLLEDIEKGVARQRRQVRSGMYRAGDEYTREELRREDLPRSRRAAEYPDERERTSESIQTEGTRYRRYAAGEGSEGRQPAVQEPVQEEFPKESSGLSGEKEDLQEEPVREEESPVAPQETVYLEEPEPEPEEEDTRNTARRVGVPVSNEDDDIRIYGRTSRMDDVTRRWNTEEIHRLATHREQSGWVDVRKPERRVTVYDAYGNEAPEQPLVYAAGQEKPAGEDSAEEERKSSSAEMSSAEDGTGAAAGESALEEVRRARKVRTVGSPDNGEMPYQRRDAAEGRRVGSDETAGESGMSSVEPAPSPRRVRRIRRMTAGENPYAETGEETPSASMSGIRTGETGNIPESPAARKADLREEQETAEDVRPAFRHEEGKEEVREEWQPAQQEAEEEGEYVSEVFHEEPSAQDEPLQERMEEAEPSAEEPSAGKVGRRELTREERRLFGPFCRMKENVEQLTEALEQISLDSSSGNLMILGNEATAERVARGILEILRRSDANFTGKIAKATGESLNKLDAKGISAIFRKLENGSLIVTSAADIAPKTLERLHAELEQEHGMILIFTDGNKRMDQFRRENESALGSFTAVINIRPLDDKALVAYAKDYAQSQDYSIDEFGQLALAQRISSMQTPTHHVTLKEVRDLVDEAISFASRRNPRVVMEIISRKRYDEDDRIILHEKDFTHY